MIARLRRLGMRIRGARQMRLRRGTYQPRHIKVHCLPRTPPAKLADLGPWEPRITRWVRMACPLPDDTAFDLAPIPGHYQPSARTVMDALGRPQWPIR